MTSNSSEEQPACAGPSGPEVIPRLDSPVTALRGVGGERAAQMERLGLRTVEDFFWHRPARYEDRRKFTPIRDVLLGTPLTVCGRIVAAGNHRFRKGTKSCFEFILDDGTARLHCRWWNLPFLEKFYSVGNEVLVYGRPNSLRPRTMDHPEVEKIEPGEGGSVHFGRIVPVYPLTEGMPQRTLRWIIWGVINRFLPHLPETGPWRTPELAGDPAAALGRQEAVRNLHFPSEFPEAEHARQRLALDELAALQREIQGRRQRLNLKASGLPCGGDNRLMRPFLSGLPFKPTRAQTRVLREIRADLAGLHPMRRLLQGDVGSGKTLVAACAALMTVESGYNVALMAPTELLAEQLHNVLAREFGPLGIGVGLWTSNTRQEPDIGSKLELGSVWVGTHALIQKAVEFSRLGLVIIDEQHKFGVAQRETLLRKGCFPHLLVMTATPIPRTLGLTLYGDLDVSLLDELPTGRGRVRTHVRTPDTLPKVWMFVARQLEAGRQAYVVYPRVSESEHDDVKSVTREFEKVRTALAPHVVAMVHGRMPSAERTAIMDAFREGRVQVLLATSVIEVGVDVPNATVMVIENAGQFGLAQLHQLRGRIGRGSHESHCILVEAERTDEARERLKVLMETTDGFAVAEADLRLRGPGELVGRNQSGLPGFRFADLVRDGKLLEAARASVQRELAAEAAKLTTMPPTSTSAQ